MQNKQRHKTMELLAPAGGPEQLTAAVLCGADAVYFGVGNFNARRGAQNFDLESLRQTVAFCHLHGTAVHLTINTLVFDRELPAAMETVRAACEAGVDALIVQDLGLARLIAQAAPDMPIHASTQMSLHNLSGVQLLEPFGYTRAVLAREMSAEEIERVCRGTSLEIETFVHGALCMCLSGQCYLSAVAGERSGNRGLCAQPCRLPFYEKDPQRCGLSLKDMSLFSHIGRLREAGVRSIKIEGRMKRPEYVAAAVTAGRAALAGEKPDLDTLRAVFSRSGFTDGYFTGKLGRHMFGVRQKEDVTAASPALLKNLARLYAKETGRVGVQAQMEIRSGMPLCLTLSDPDGNSILVSGAVPEAARSKETTEEMVRQSLSKLGGTPYYLKKANISLDCGLAVPVSELNRLRREAVEKLSAKRSHPKTIPFSAPQVEPLPGPNPEKSPALWVRLQYPGQLDRELWRQVQRIILPLDQLASLPVTGLEEKLVAQLRSDAFLRGKTAAIAFRLLRQRDSVRHDREPGRDSSDSKAGDAGDRRFRPKCDQLPISNPPEGNGAGCGNPVHRNAHSRLHCHGAGPSQRDFRLREDSFDDGTKLPRICRKRLSGLPGIPGHVRPAQGSLCSGLCRQKGWRKPKRRADLQLSAAVSGRPFGRLPETGFPHSIFYRRISRSCSGYLKRVPKRRPAGRYYTRAVLPAYQIAGWKGEFLFGFVFSCAGHNV